MVGDLESCKLSEVAWRGGAEGGGERFLFDHPTVCAVYRAGELTLIEYGKNDVRMTTGRAWRRSCLAGRLGLLCGLVHWHC
jgi:hypothetical protein